MGFSEGQVYSSEQPQREAQKAGVGLYLASLIPALAFYPKGIVTHSALLHSEQSGNETEKDLGNKQRTRQKRWIRLKSIPPTKADRARTSRIRPSRTLLAATIRDNAIVRRVPSRLETAAYRSHPSSRGPQRTCWTTIPFHPFLESSLNHGGVWLTPLRLALTAPPPKGLQ
jgi:hypothetical protein